MSSSAQLSPNASCSFQGNPDLLGLGIRVGIYCQLQASIIANHALPDAVSATVDTNAIFLFALLVAVTKATVEGGLSTVEAYVVLQFLFSFLLSAVKVEALRMALISLASTLGQSEFEAACANYHLSRFGIYWRQCISLTSVIYNTWFWFDGKIRMNHHRDCNFRIFFFSSLSGFGTVQNVFKVLAVGHVFSEFSEWCDLIRISPWIPKEMAQPADQITKPEKNHEPVTKSSLFSLSMKTWDYRRYDRDEMKAKLEEFRQILSQVDESLTMRRSVRHWWDVIHRFMLATDILIVVWTVLAVELSLIWSHVTGIYEVSSTSQLIPLVIGLSGVMQNTLQVLYKKTREFGLHTDGKKPTPTLDRASGFWQYGLGEGYLVRFGINTTIQRRWSSPDIRDSAITHRLSKHKLLQGEGQPPAPAPIVLGDLSGSSLNLTRTSEGSGNSLQSRFVTRDGRLHVFSKSGAERSLSCNDVRSLKIRTRRRRGSGGSSRSDDPDPDHSDSSSSWSSDRADSESDDFSSWSASRKPMWSRLRRLTSTQALARKGRELPTIEVEWLTAKWYHNRPGCPKALQVPFDKGRLNRQLRRKHRDHRWSFDEKLEWSERNIPEVVDDSFQQWDGPLYVRRLKGRKPAWNRKRLLVYYFLVMLLYPTIVLGLPGLIVVCVIRYGAIFQDDAKGSKSSQQRHSSEQSRSPAKIPFRQPWDAFHAWFTAVFNVWYGTCYLLVAVPLFGAHMMTEVYLPDNATSLWELGSSMLFIITSLIMSPLLVMGLGVWFWLRGYGKLKSREQKIKALERTVLALFVVPLLLPLMPVWLSWRATKKWKGQKEKKRDDIV